MSGNSSGAIANWEVTYKTGWTVIGIRGIRVHNVNVTCMYAYISSGAIANVRLHNYSSSTVTTTVSLQLVAIDGDKYHIWL